MERVHYLILFLPTSQIKIMGSMAWRKLLRYESVSVYFLATYRSAHLCFLGIPSTSVDPLSNFIYPVVVQHQPQLAATSIAASTTSSSYFEPARPPLFQPAAPQPPPPQTSFVPHPPPSMPVVFPPATHNAGGGQGISQSLPPNLAHPYHQFQRHAHQGK